MNKLLQAALKKGTSLLSVDNYELSLMSGASLADPMAPLKTVMVEAGASQTKIFELNIKLVDPMTNVSPTLLVRPHRPT